VEKEVERADALLEPPLQPHPLRVRDDPRHQVERKHALDPLLLVIDRERDPLVEERHVGLAAPLVESVDRHVRELLAQGGVVRADLAGGGEHLVEETVEGVRPVHHGPAVDR